MDIDLTNYIKSIYGLFMSVNTTKINHKKNIYFLREGFINFTVKIGKSINCNLCGDNSMCYHIFYIFIKHYNFSNFVLSFLGDDDIYEIFLKNIKKENLNIIMENEIINKIEGIECGICLDYLKLNGYNFSKGLYKCTICKKYLHDKCVSMWFRKSKGSKNRGKCIYCLQISKN